MKKYTHIVMLMLLFVSLKIHAQDKVFLRNGKVIPCKIIVISENTISYKDSLINAPLVTISKNEVLLTEYGTGNIFMFSKEKEDINGVYHVTDFSIASDENETRDQRNARKLKEWKEQELLLKNNILGFYVTQLIFGRLTLSYERLFANKSMGILIPFSLTFDALGALAENSANHSSSSTNSTNSNNNSSSSSTKNGAVKRTAGTGFITGIDVNYYHDLKPALKYYFGPRIRYGTDMMLGGIEGLTFQIQNGIFKSNGKKMTSSVGFGVGFFKLSQKYAGSRLGTKQVYPWASFTWRLGFRL